MPLRRDHVIAQFLRQHGGDDPEAVVGRLCEELLEEAGTDIPIDMRMLASFRDISEIKTVNQEEAGCIFFDGSRLVMQIRAQDREERRRFTIGHEINHTFFPGFREQRRSRTDSTIGRYDRSDAEEYLCDVGAAELLLPRQAILERLPTEINLDVVIDTAETFRATIEATALRVAALSATPTAVVVLEPGWRRAEEEEEIRQRGLYKGLLGHEPPPIPKKLRVRWAVSRYGMPAIPARKSVANDTPLAHILEMHAIDYLGYTGLIEDKVIVSARYMPYRRDGKLVQRVIAMLRK